MNNSDLYENSDESMVCQNDTSESIEKSNDSETNMKFPDTPFTIEVVSDMKRYSQPSSSGKYKGKIHDGEYVVQETSNGWGKLDSGCWVPLENPSEYTIKSDASADEVTFEPYDVNVDITNLNVRTGPGTNYDVIGQSKKGVFTIVDTQSGEGSSSGWGKLESGDGWISLDYVKRI